MGNYRQPVTTFTSSPIGLDSPIGGDADDRRRAIPDGVKKLRFPAESGGLYVKFGDATVDADTSPDFYVPWGSSEVVAVPAGATHFSIFSESTGDEWIVVVQGVE